MFIASAPVASAQRADGAIGVSLTILPATAARNVVVTDERIESDGGATIRTSASMTTSASQLVMTRASASTDAFATTRHVPAAECVARERPCEVREVREVRYRTDARRPGHVVAPQDVRLRVEYLVVAGT